jgi:DNA helicase HerA-like ATPase
MANKEQFVSEINNGYTFKGDAIIIGGAMLDGDALNSTLIKAPLKTFNRHGLIAGATGSGKTKTMQGIAEALSQKGVPCLLMDIKGDLSGLAKPAVSNSKIEERHAKIGTAWKPVQFPVELMSLSATTGVKLRATVSEFGPVLFSKILELNDTQAGVVSLVFKYSDDKKLPLLDLKDFKKVLQFLTNEGKAEIKQEYGAISTATTSTIIRKIIEIEQQGAEKFFGEKSFEVEDLLRIDDNGLGYLNIIRLTDLQDKPKLFSTFMLSLLAEVYSTFPEVGDPDAPKLVIFIDEAHLIFNNASKVLLEQIETIIKLIRSKGVGVFFVTQSPEDIPASVLAQLGMKVQHAFRAFTANDRKALKKIAENYPLCNYYKTEDLLTQLGIGEALVTVLSEKGTPTPLAHTLLCAPASRMDVLTEAEIKEVCTQSSLIKKYNEDIDEQSAFEILQQKINAKAEEQPEETTAAKKAEKEEPGMLEQVADSSVGKQVMRTVARELTRGLLGVLGVGTTRRNSTRKKGWF